MEAEPFWKRLTLDEMSRAEWESLCDGCARCCLNKLEDWDTGAIYWTNVRCSLLDEESCRCSDYSNRNVRVPDCIPLDPEAARTLSWLPPTCGYRLIAEGRDLYWWHPLVSGDPDTIHAAGISVRGRTVSEEGMAVEDYEKHLVEWPGERPGEKGGLPILAFENLEGLEDWLEENHADSAGIWLQIGKAAAGVASVSYSEVVDAVLAFGWIDGQKAPGDDRHWLQRLTPRKSRSKWSKLNRERAEALIAADRMRPAGLAAVEAAKADGRWEAAYAPPSQAAIPDDLARAFAEAPEAAAFFSGLDSTNRFAVLHRIETAKKAETRAKRIRDFVAMLARGETIHPPRR